MNILWTKKCNIRKYTTFCGRINEDGERKSKILEHHIGKMWIFYGPKKGNFKQHNTFSGGINGDYASKYKKSLNIFVD